MGATLSCFQPRDEEEDEDRQSRRCLCFTFAVDPVRRLWTTLLHQVNPASHPRRLMVPERILDDSSCDTYQPPPRPLSFDDPRCSYIYSAGLTSPSHPSSHLRGTLEPNINNDESDVKSFGVGEKCKISDSVPSKQEPRELEYGLLYAFTFPEEDLCPICLEDYISENPKITLRCMHHFHLACIYEWMERSETCPICGKVMELDER